MISAQAQRWIGMLLVIVSFAWNTWEMGEVWHYCAIGLFFVGVVATTWPRKERSSLARPLQALVAYVVLMGIFYPPSIIAPVAVVLLPVLVLVALVWFLVKGHLIITFTVIVLVFGALLALKTRQELGEIS